MSIADITPVGAITAMSPDEGLVSGVACSTANAFKAADFMEVMAHTVRYAALAEAESAR